MIWPISDLLKWPQCYNESRTRIEIKLFCGCIIFYLFEAKEPDNIHLIVSHAAAAAARSAIIIIIPNQCDQIGRFIGLWATF